MSDPVLVELARVAAGLTQGALAKGVGVSQPFVSQVERGERPIPAEHLAKWAEFCDVPPSFFLRTDTPLDDDVSGMVHRRMKTLPTKPFNLANAQVKVTCLQIDSLFSEVEVEPALMVPDFPAGIGPADAADALRKAWQVPTGPLPNLIGLVESAGIPVIMLDSFHDKHSATSHRGRWVKWVIALNANHTASRRRFSLAHDLGHIALGHEPHNAIDEAGGPDRLEAEADEFAVALLIPRRDAMRELRGAADFKRLVALKQRWRVSVAFLIQQAHALGMISDSKRQSHYIQLSSLPGGRRREPGEFEAENSTLIRRIVESLTQDGLTLQEISVFATVTEHNLRERFLGERPALRAVPTRPARTRLDLRSIQSN